MSDIVNAIKQICEEKGLSYEAVVSTIESALAAAYRKDFGKKNQNIRVEYDPETSKSKVYDIKTVVEDLPEEEEAELIAIAAEEEERESGKATDKFQRTDKNTSPASESKEPAARPSTEESAAAAEGENEEEERKFNPKTDIQIKDAKELKKSAKIGDEIKIKLEIPDEYGRMAAQTAKQVIIQRLREAEREMIFGEFKSKEKEVVSGVVQRREGRVVLVDLGKAVGLLLYEDQIPGEFYKPGERIKVYVREVNLKAKGPEILLSRTSDEILRKVFYLEIPEIANNLIELKGVAREAGYRSKVAVASDSNNVDPIGSCVGQRGARIQTIIAELGGEKVDIIEYDEDPIKYISNALSPARIVEIKIDEEARRAKVSVAADQLSLAIGKGGQNARLAAKLTGWKIDIVETGKDDKNKKPAEKTGADIETPETATEDAQNIKPAEDADTGADSLEKTATEEEIEEKPEEKTAKKPKAKKNKTKSE